VETEAPPATTVTLRVNGTRRTLTLDNRTTLLDALRERLGLTGAKNGCDQGQCGACTVLVEGRRMNACLLLAVVLDGAEVTTVESLSDGENLHPVQRAFIEHDAFQCGYCTSGQICSVLGLLGGEESHQVLAADDEVLRDRLSGNLCRCGAYEGVVRAVKEVLTR
jgi:xanthine dehydrogenase YagT iron-sulfur-binding subunit